MTTGVLEWGQAGNYNAVNDRLVIRALSQIFGLRVAPTMAAGSGLTVNIGPWLAIVDCGDGTSAVIGNTASSSIAETAGGASQRTDALWADINVDGTSQYSLSWLPSPVSGRTGVQLGQAVVPTSAATAAAMTFTPSYVTGGSPYDTWHDFRPLTNSFIGTLAGFIPPQWRRTADGFTEIIGEIKTPPTTGNYNSVVWGTISDPLARPPYPGNYLITGAADGAASPKVQIAANGQCQLNYLPTSLAQTQLTIWGRFPNVTFGGLLT